jgi:catechol 2,3-dioxygenase-like lactoylglutathione lyase family enzyme
MSTGRLAPYELRGMQPVLAVPDVLETVAYYRDQLGFHVDFVAGDPPIHARVCADPNASSRTVHAYRDRGVTVVRAPEDRPWGLRQFTIEDCNGYRLSFSAELAAT